MHDPLKRALDNFLQVIFPQPCPGCGTPLTKHEKELCLQCRQNLPRLFSSRTLNSPVLQRFAGQLPVTYAWSYLKYQKRSVTQRLLYQLKYESQPELGKMLGLWFGAELLSAQALAGIEALVPVPLHPIKEARRGYNQSLLIAQGLSESTNLPVLPALERIKFTSTQTRMSSAERAKNMEQVFMVKNSESIQGKHLAVVDDVVTTGSTLIACGGELLKAGAAEVSFLTLAAAQRQ